MRACAWPGYEAISFAKWRGQSETPMMPHRTPCGKKMRNGSRPMSLSLIRLCISVSFCDCGRIENRFLDHPMHFVRGPHIAFPQVHQMAIRTDESSAEIVGNDSAFWFMDEA